MEISLSSTIGETLADYATRTPHAPAILYPGFTPLSFGDLGRHLNRMGAALRVAGIGSTSRVGVALPRGPEAALVSLAVSSIATMLPINPNIVATDLEAELDNIRVDALIIPAGGDVPGWAKKAGGLFEVTPAKSSFGDIELRPLTPVVRKNSAAQISPKSVSVIFRTSGTTGAAKRVPVTHENLLEMARKMQRWLRLTPADRSACILPIYYNAGFKATLLAPLLIGCSVAMPASTNPQEFERWLGALEPTWLTAAPAFLQAVVERLRARPGARLSHSLRFVLSTASYLAESVRRELETQLGVPVVEFYGLCEAGMVTAPPLPPDKAKPGTVGRGPAGELAIRADDGAFLPAGQTGQIVLRGPSVSPGYLYDIDDTPSGLEEGWLPTGDLGVVDDEGFLTIVGRTKEIINRGGEKISPYDVEKALLLHPAVREAAAFAVPHPRLGENVAAAVTLNPGTLASSSELVEFIYDRLAPFQMPRQVHILPSLPVGATGKISRPQLAKIFASQARNIARPEQPLQIQIAEIWQRYLHRPDIGLDNDFFDLGGDSLQATDMLIELEETTRQTISPSDIRAQLTIRNLAQALARVAASSPIVTRVKDGDGVPLFLCHGDFDGWGLYAFRLVDLLRHQGPVFLLHSNLDRATGITTIEEMARTYIPHLLAAWPRGPFKLAGYCHGGLAAWEMAHQLEAIGRKADSVILIDTYSINARPLVRGIARALNAFGGLSPDSLGERVHGVAMPALWSGTRRLLQKDREIFWRVARRLYRAQRPSSGPERGGVSMRWAYYQAMSNYLPPKIDANVVCLLSDEYAHRPEFTPVAWKSLARHVEFEQVPGRHNTCITSHVADLATALSRHLALT